MSWSTTQGAQRTWTDEEAIAMASKVVGFDVRQWLAEHRGVLRVETGFGFARVVVASDRDGWEVSDFGFGEQLPGMIRSAFAPK